MNWNSFADFLAMGGYARYVWGSVGVFAVCLLGEVLALRARGRAVRALVAALNAGTKGRG